MPEPKPNLDPSVPCAQDAEHALLGCLLIGGRNGVIELISPIVQAEDFFFEVNQQAFTAIVAAKGDYTVAAEALKVQWQGDKTFPDPFVRLLEMIGQAETNVTRAEEYAHLIHRYATARLIIRAAGEMAQLGYKVPEEMEMMAAVERIAATIRREVQPAEDLHLSGPDAVCKLMERMDEVEGLMKHGRGMPDTPWHALNEALSPFGSGQLITVAGPTGCGKTIFVEGLAEHNAQRGHTVLFYHLELSPEEMAKRSVMRLSKEPLERHGLDVGVTDRSFLAAVGQTVSEWPGKVIYVHCPGWTAEQITSDWRAQSARRRVGLVVIDYLHKISYSDVKGRSDEMHLATIVEAIKTTAEVTGIPCVLGCQVTKSDRISRSGQKITLPDCRGTGQTAEKSNVVFGLWNGPQAEGTWQDGNCVVQVYVLKNTTGPLSTVNLVWIPARLAFRDVKATADEYVPSPPPPVPWYNEDNGQEAAESQPVVPPPKSTSVWATQMAVAAGLDDAAQGDGPGASLSPDDEGIIRPRVL